MDDAATAETMPLDDMQMSGNGMRGPGSGSPMMAKMRGHATMGDALRAHPELANMTCDDMQMSRTGLHYANGCSRACLRDLALRGGAARS